MPEGVRLSRILLPVGIITAVGLMISMAFMIYGKSEYNSILRSQLAPLQGSIALQLEEMTTLQGQIQQVEAELAPIAARAGIFDTTLTSLEAGRQQASSDLVEVVNLLPGAIDLTGIKHEGGSIEVKGIAPTVDNIFSYARDLRTSFSSVIILSIDAVEQEGWVTGFDFKLFVR